MKTSELIGPALDWAVAKCEGYSVMNDGINHLLKKDEELLILGSGSSVLNYSPSTNWEQGGPIIERAELFVKPTINKGWRSYQRDKCMGVVCNSQYGPTPLIAAMRTYVASKLGDDITIPKELK